MADPQKPTGLVKFVNDKDGGDRGDLHWGRAHTDGAPFRGKQRPLYTDAEYENRVTKVGDPQNAVFDLNVEAENKQYLAIMDKIVNCWATLIHVERMITLDKKQIYIEWVQWYMEDGITPQHRPPGLNQGRPHVGS